MGKFKVGYVLNWNYRTRDIAVVTKVSMGFYYYNIYRNGGRRSSTVKCSREVAHRVFHYIGSLTLNKHKIGKFYK